MMRQALQQARPERGRAGMSPAIGRTVPLNPGFAAVRTRGTAAVRRPEHRGHRLAPAGAAGSVPAAPRAVAGA